VVAFSFAIALTLICQINAKMLVTFDALEAEVYVNGERVYVDETTGWDQDAMFDISLNERENIIAVHAFKDGWPAGALLCVLIPEEAGLIDPKNKRGRWVQIEGKRYLVLLTSGEGSGWKASSVERERWWDFGFDDSYWHDAEGGAEFHQPPWSWGYDRFRGTGARWMWVEWHEFAHHHAYFRMKFTLEDLVYDLTHVPQKPQRRPHATLEHVAFKAGEKIDIRLNYPQGHELKLTFEGGSYPMRWAGGRYVADLPPVEPGVYQIEVREAESSVFKGEIIVWNRRNKRRGKLVRLSDDGMFVGPDDKLFILRGFAVNHIFYPDADSTGIRGGWIESAWNHAGERELADWLGFLAMNGINVLRIGLTVYGDGIPGDRGGYADPEVMDALERFLTVADSMRMKVIPVFYWGRYGTFGFRNETYDEILKGKGSFEWFTNRDAIELQKRFIGDVLGRFKNDPRVLAWELMNEISASMHPIFLNWVNEMAGYIRGLGVRNLIKVDFLPRNGADMAVCYGNRTDVDLYGYRGYPIGRATGDLGTYLSAHARYAKITKAVGLVGEFGSKERRRIVTRDAVWMSLLAGAPGVIAWDGGMCAPDEFKIAAQIFDRIDLAEFKRAKPPVAIRVQGHGRDLYDLMRYDEYFQKKGYDYDVIPPDTQVTPSSYSTVLDTRDYGMSNWWRILEFEPPRITSKPILEISDGYQASYMMDEGGDILILYLRNMAGVDRNGIRVRRKTSLRLTVRLGEGEFKVKKYDLDEKAITGEGILKEEFSLFSGRTDHDFVLLFKRR
jgi:hypothetical protein